MDTLSIALVGITLTQFALIWYKLGKVESTVAGLCDRMHKINGYGKGEVKS